MRTRLTRALLLWLLAVSAAVPAWGRGATESGRYGDINWKVADWLVGQTSTAPIAAGGDPIYLAQGSRYRGVVGLLIQYADGSAYGCSGSLLSDRASILTAGHCVSKGYGTATPDKVTALFYDGNPADPVFYNNALFGKPAPGVTAVDISKIFVDNQYTGDTIDEHDVAVLRLASAAPKYATSYQLYDGTDLTGLDYNFAGYGGASDIGGLAGADLAGGRLRQGDNRFDFSLGDSDFGGFFTSPNPFCGAGTNLFCGTAAIDDVYIADFDDGLFDNDGSCLLAVYGLGAPLSGKYCDGGRGATEASTAEGDSGGPEFIDGKIASVTSFGLSFGSSFGDIDDDLNSTFGELNGAAPVYANRAFIDAALAAPEPAAWAMMISGFVMIGAALRRRAIGLRRAA